MRLLTSTAVLSCACAAVLSGAVAGAPAAKPRLVSNRPVETGARWIGVVDRVPPPSRDGSPRAPRPGGDGAPPSPGPLPAARDLPTGRTLGALGRRQRLGTVLVRQAPLRLTNAMDVVVEPSGSLLVSDFSDRVFRLNGNRLTLLAGNGRPGHAGDGGPAVRAAIGFPVELALDPRGGFGIVHGERWVRHVDPSGTITTVAEFQQPTALAYDSGGNLWVSELLGGVKRRDAATGAVTTYPGFNRPHGLAVAADGTVYVADTFNNRVQRISPNGLVNTLADGINQPNDVALGPDGNIYSTDWGNSRILRITPDRRRDEDRGLLTTQLGRRGRGRHGLRHGGSPRRREANHGCEPRRLQAGDGGNGLDRDARLEAATRRRHGPERRDDSGRVRKARRPEPLPPARGLPLLRPMAAPRRATTSRRRGRPTGTGSRLQAPDGAGVPALRRDRSAVSAVRALPRPGERRAVGLLSPTGSTAPNLTGLGRDARDPPADEHSVLDRRRAGRRLERRARPDREPDRHANRPVGHGA